MEGIISVNGKISDPQQGCIPALDRGFLFGDNIFEVLVGFGKKILEPKEHLQRLRKSSELTGIPIPWSDEELIFEISSLLSYVETKKAYIRLIVTRGNGLGLKASENPTPNRVVFCFPVETNHSPPRSTGFSLATKIQSFTDRGASPKTGNYLRSIHALSQVSSLGFDDVLWANSNQEITEASTANIFLIGRQGDLVEIATPPAMSGLLLGITRARITHLLALSQIKVTERVIYTDELPSFDEGFLCSTVRGIVPISRIDGHRMHTLRRNSTYQHIERLYLTWVESELGYRIDWATGDPV